MNSCPHWSIVEVNWMNISPNYTSILVILANGSTGTKNSEKWIKIQNAVFYTLCETCHARLWATSYVDAWKSDITIRWLYPNTIWMRYARKSSWYGGCNFERIPYEMSPITLDVGNCSTDIKGHVVYECMSCVHRENYGWHYISPQFCNVRVHIK